jgi:hypothetical protein
MISRLRALWRNLFGKRQLDDDLDEELSAYAELVSAEKVKTGMSPDEACHSTRREMGGVEQVRQSVRDIRAGVLLERLAQAHPSAAAASPYPPAWFAPPPAPNR